MREAFPYLSTKRALAIILNCASHLGATSTHPLSISPVPAVLPGAGRRWRPPLAMRGICLLPVSPPTASCAPARQTSSRCLAARHGLLMARRRKGIWPLAQRVPLLVERELAFEAHTFVALAIAVPLVARPGANGRFATRLQDGPMAQSCLIEICSAGAGVGPAWASGAELWETTEAVCWGLRLKNPIPRLVLRIDLGHYRDASGARDAGTTLSEQCPLSPLGQEGGETRPDSGGTRAGGTCVQGSGVTH